MSPFHLAAIVGLVTKLRAGIDQIGQLRVRSIDRIPE